MGGTAGALIHGSRTMGGAHAGVALDQASGTRGARHGLDGTYRHDTDIQNLCICSSAYASVPDPGIQGILHVPSRSFNNFRWFFLPGCAVSVIEHEVATCGNALRYVERCDRRSTHLLCSHEVTTARQ